MRLALAVVMASACSKSFTPPHWKDQPIEPQSDSVDGVKFTIDLPKGMKQLEAPVEKKQVIFWHYTLGGANDDPPDIEVSHRTKQTLDEALAQEKLPPLHKEQMADGWVYSVENAAQKGTDDWYVHSQKFVGDGALTCTGRVYPKPKGVSAKDLVPLVEKMCLSLKAQP